MAEEQTGTAKTSAWEKAKTWNDYFNEDNKKNVSIENSTGYQLYAVNEDTIANNLSDFNNFTPADAYAYTSGTLNLQLADATYNNGKNRTTVTLTGDYRDAIPFRKISKDSKISKSFLMSNNDFKFNETIGTNLGKNLNIESIVINEYQQEQRAFNGTLIDQLISIVSKRNASS